MTVLDLIIKLQSLPPNMPVMIDSTNESMESFKFSSIVFVDEVEVGTNEQVVLLSHQFLDETEDSEDNEPNFRFN